MEAGAGVGFEDQALGRADVDDSPGDFGHAIEQARVLEVLDIAGDSALRGACWNQTSVCCNPWYVYDDSNEDDEGRAYNVEKDTFGWWLSLSEYGDEGITCEEIHD